jgi:hypothetical protein
MYPERQRLLPRLYGMDIKKVEKLPSALRIYPIPGN